MYDHQDNKFFAITLYTPNDVLPYLQGIRHLFCTAKQIPHKRSNSVALID